MSAQVAVLGLEQKEGGQTGHPARPQEGDRGPRSGEEVGWGHLQAPAWQWGQVGPGPVTEAWALQPYTCPLQFIVFNRDFLCLPHKSN